jgi:hypothetical protein
MDVQEGEHQETDHNDECCNQEEHLHIDGESNRKRAIAG